ncbi:MAG: DUF1343 domain-containing protein [Marinilabiliales bacterium]|nr:MAG: DUF1343 domain-containing protein [Marinilabiliales bacterium]
MAGLMAQGSQLVEYESIVTGARQYQKYESKIRGKVVAVVANMASTVGDKHLVDFLLEKEVRIAKVFSPEHGFRGDKDAGELVDSNIDAETGIQLVSLYGQHKKPTYSDLENIDVVIFDLQDVGVRFYTYISTLTYVMEACAENGVKLIVLDRPNPNGFYVDGPVLEEKYKSFVGMHPVPIVYGMTIGEYAKMVNGENWLYNGLHCDLTVIPLENYSRNMIVKLPIKPSPNLPNWESIYLYPSLCLFEGTVVSVGRGTRMPFQIYGHPQIVYGSFVFTPFPNAGSKKPKLQGEKCYGQNLKGYAHNYKNNESGLNLLWLTEAYKTLNNDSTFFNNYFEKLAGTDKLRKQIEKEWSQQKIKKSWQQGIKKFKAIREKYLIYN